MHQEYGHSLKPVFLIASFPSPVTIGLSHQMQFDPITSYTFARWPICEHLYSPFQIIVVISKIESLDIVLGTMVLEEFDELLTLVRCDMFFPGSICLYRDIPRIGISIY
jgi:hypothetical protein